MNALAKKMKQETRRGFALLLSVVVVSVIITTTLAVSALVARGLDLTTVGERSMRAFFAASSGLECALYWDIRQRIPPGQPNEGASPFRGGTHGTFSTDDINCLGQSLTVQNYTTLSNTRQFEINHQGICASVMVILDGMRTEVRSSGFSVCSPTMGDIERGLTAEY
jgi:hypothetical protein